VLIVILAREFTITGLRAVAASEGTVIAAGASGKLKTVFQMLAVLALLLQDMSFGYAYSQLGRPLATGLLVVAVILTAYSGAEYVVKSRRLFL
jgi:phosphatidylglycerophosphate synthase